MARHAAQQNSNSLERYAQDSCQSNSARPARRLGSVGDRSPLAQRLSQSKILPMTGKENKHGYWTAPKWLESIALFIDRQLDSFGNSIGKLPGPLPVIFGLSFLGLAIAFWAVTIPLWAIWYFGTRKKVEDDERLAAEQARRNAETAAQEAERQRYLKAQSDLQAEMLRLGEKSLTVFESSPALIEAAEGYLEQAARDFEEGVFAPFWDSVERAATALGRFDEGVRDITEASSRYTGLVKVFDSVPPAFPLSVPTISKLAAATGTAEKMRGIVRKAQGDFQFATIYEQRKTNQILVKGFTSLGQALEQMTWRITGAIDDLATSVNRMSSRLEESVRAVDARLGAMQADAAQYRDTALQSEKARSAREAKTVEMLDNIQRNRKPWP